MASAHHWERGVISVIATRGVRPAFGVVAGRVNALGMVAIYTPKDLGSNPSVSVNELLVKVQSKVLQNQPSFIYRLVGY